MAKITAPFTPTQVDSMNKYQQSGVFHSFTCINDSHADLIATEEGWICPLCDYKQGWAHDWMGDYRWEAALPENNTE